MKTNLTKKQFLSIAAILVLGALLGALILNMGGTSSVEAKEQGHSKENAEAGHKDEHAEAGHKEGKAGGQHGEEKRAAKPGEKREEKPGEKREEKPSKIALNEAQAKAAGITVSTAGAANINTVVTLPGEIRYNEDRTAHVVPRLGGVVERVLADLGQGVKKGQVLAVIASTGLSEQRSELLTAQKRLSLARTTFEREKKLWEDKISAEQDYLQARQAMQEAEIAVQNARQKLEALGASATSARGLNSYEVRAPFDGMVMEKHLSLGEAVKEDASIFTISDLSTVWAEVAVPAKDLNAIRVGEKVVVNATAFDAKATGTVAYVGSLIGEQTRTAKARVSLANPNMAWRPGLFVNVEVVSGQTEAPVAISAEAIQTIENKTTVFLSVPGGFVAQEVTLGRSNGKVVEVTKGLQAGAPYVSTNSFILKSELGKAGAEHAH
ncbi:efflux RND transporter periplasmic adaptor subunit [Noviherbaspirillum suwonense]|uniref:Membrane fusion protein, cobalt-zinc-cadmium efflux system n=1 Tax=Noviherbaspirillum suwonense TaxID=1224511 RepID=A0ABY1Q1F8_9BURK|nr:efflux RND transporter periplasmic adaptor subunit [Noviherbaspirillum suwonense]SMP52149.1 membrane fusion protein, cobalt-zinc-cadmium efflux system [Noviherbaspirillum suwonense]